ncbi:MAG: type II secretion system protein N [Succinivibrionaceae bacterium]|nr:type II secretion system protein N [Succinivibrionaceae bacterium]
MKPISQLKQIKPLKLKYQLIIMAVAFLLLFAVCLVYQAPASKILAMVSLPDGVYLEGVKGRAVDGSAKVLHVDKYEYNNINWTASLLGLLTGRYTVKVADPKGLTGKTDISYGNGDVEVNNLHVGITFQNMLKYTKYTLPVDVSGSITVGVSNAVFNAKRCKKMVSGNIDITGLDVFTPLGNYAIGDGVLALSCRNGLFIVKLKQENPYFSIDGNMEYDMKDQLYRVKAFAKPSPAKGNEVKPLLQMMGQPNSTGTYEINFQGKFSY